jgi:hypothetical protein
MPANWHEQRLREERSERIKEQEAKRDPELEQAVIAYHAHRTSGGTMMFAEFRSEWIKTNGGQDGR